MLHSTSFSHRLRKAIRRRRMLTSPRLEAGSRALPGSSCPSPSGGRSESTTDPLPCGPCRVRFMALSANRHWRTTMPNKDASEKEKESGVRRTASKAKAHPLVPTNESTKEAGPRRLYAAPNSTTSTSTKESGARRIYTSASGSSGNMGAKPQR